MTGEPPETLRIDKWLWQTRFFKTRTMAAEIVQKGRVRVDSQRITKPGRNIAPGNVLTFPQGRHVRVIRVLGMPARRGPAAEAQALYEDLDTARDDVTE